MFAAVAWWACLVLMQWNMHACSSYLVSMPIVLIDITSLHVCPIRSGKKDNNVSFSLVVWMRLSVATPNCSRRFWYKCARLPTWKLGQYYSLYVSTVCMLPYIEDICMPGISCGIVLQWLPYHQRNARLREKCLEDQVHIFYELSSLCHVLKHCEYHHSLLVHHKTNIWCF